MSAVDRESGEQGELAGCRIVETRPADQAAELADPLRGLGAVVRARPLTAIAAPADPAQLRAALASLEHFSWIAFTSANAVRACASLLPPAARWPAVSCVGPGTARAAAAAGIPVTLVPEVFGAEGLARAMVRLGRLRGARVLWPRASGARPTLGALLREAGADVAEVECYRTVADPAAAAALARELNEDPADVLVFTAPSAVETYASAVAGSPGGAVAVIGEVTATAAVAAGWEVRVQPAEQSITGLLAALRSWWLARAE